MADTPGDSARGVRPFHVSSTFALLALVLTGCAPTIDSTTFLPHLPPSRAADHPIRVYYTRLPACPYDELGLISAGRRSSFVSMEKVQSALLDQARRMGGDALLNVTEGSEVRGSGEGVHARRILRGTVVRFTDPACTDTTAPTM